MIVYEEYENAKEKHSAQRASGSQARKQPTGKARGYLLVLDEDGVESVTPKGSKCYSGYGEKFGEKKSVIETEDIAACTIDEAHLASNCRVIGCQYLPPDWMKAFADILRGIVANYPGPEGRTMRMFLSAQEQVIEPVQEPTQHS